MSRNLKNTCPIQNITDEFEMIKPKLKGQPLVKVSLNVSTTDSTTDGWIEEFIKRK